MHVLLLNTTATNLEVSVEPERGFSFMNATKTMARNNLIEKTLNNLPGSWVCIRHLSMVRPPSESHTHPDVAAKRELEQLVDACMARWDSIKARRCRSEAYIMSKTRLQWLTKERSGLGKRRSKQAV
jgi:hypothetical protein